MKTGGLTGVVKVFGLGQNTPRCEDAASDACANHEKTQKKYHADLELLRLRKAQLEDVRPGQQQDHHCAGTLPLAVLH